MYIDLSWLKLHPKETDTFHLDGVLREAQVLEGVKIVDSVTVDLEVSNTGRLMVGKGEIRANLEMVCDLCLKNFEKEVTVPFTVELCEEDNRAYFKNEESFVYFEDPRVDLEPVVVESLILSLPIRTICAEECKGLCSGCGQDLNQGKCQCQEKEIDPRWEALKKML